MWEPYKSTKSVYVPNIIGIEEGGELTFVNENKYSVPSEAVFYLNSNNTIGATKLIGDLKGTADVARYYEVNGSVSTETIGAALERLQGSPIKITAESIGTLAASNGQGVVRGVGIIANPPISVGDIVIDKHLEGDAAYLCFWQITQVDTGYVTLSPLSNIYVGGGSASVADKAIADGNGKNIAETYETKANAKAVTDEIRDTANNAYERSGAAITASQDALNRVNRGVQSISADYTSGAGSIGSFYLRVNFVGGGSESYNITEAMRGLINDVLTYDR